MTAEEYPTKYHNSTSPIYWTRCNCGFAACDRWQPDGMGTFYQGTGFSSIERDRIDSAFIQAGKYQEARDEASRLCFPDTTGQ